MSLDAIHARGVFDDATTDERRTQVYVRSGELGLPVRADVELMQALTEREFPQRLHIVGPSGAGTTSLILRVAADLIPFDRDTRHEILILRVGDRPERLRTPRGEFKAPVVSYSANLKEAFETLEFGQNASRVRHDLEDVLGQVTRAGYRPVLVIDDTEKFVSPGVGGKLDEGRRRMQRDGVDVELETVIERAAIEELQVLYHDRDRDLRSVLKVAHAAAGHALGRRATTIRPRDVRAVVAATTA